MDTLVVGAGEMGRWAGHVLRDAFDARLSFLDREREVARGAATDVGGRALAPAALAAEPAGEARFDLVCIAVPIPATVEAVRTYGPYAGEAVIDVTGTMTEPVAAMADLTGRERASLHPLFAPDNEPGNVPVVIEEGGPTIDRLLETLEHRGNDVFETTPEEHDGAMETVQARTHAAVLAFALAAESVPGRFHTPVSADLAVLVDRVTDGDHRVYDDIQTAFDGAEDVAAAARRVADASGDSFEQLYREAGTSRVDDTYGGTDTRSYARGPQAQSEDDGPNGNDRAGSDSHGNGGEDE